MLKRLFRWVLSVKKKPIEKRKRVSCDDLSRVLSEESMRTQSGGCALEGCVQWSRADGSDNERGYESIVFWIKNLEIEITDCRDKHYSDHDAEIRYGLSDVSAGLSFENCHFLQSNIDETGIKFVPGFDDSDLGESLSFVRNTGGCEFSFPGRSRVVFDQNNFTNIVVKKNEDHDSDLRKRVYFEFKENKFGRLDLNFPFPCGYPISCHFFGGNEIDVLKWDQVVNRRESDHPGNVVKYDDVQEYNLLSISFERNEKIGWRLLNTRYAKKYGGRFRDMRDLFVRLRNLAHVRGDIGQENTIANYISLVEYARVKNSKWYKSWRGWQDWLLLGWRWVSSGFYMSWIRPIGLLLLGYFILNFIPFIWAGLDGIREVSWGKYWDFCVYTPAKIFLYADSLEDVLGDGAYARLKGEFLFGEVGLNTIGIFRLVWIWLCGAAFRNAIKTYSSK